MKLILTINTKVYQVVFVKLLLVTYYLTKISFIERDFLFATFFLQKC